ncbi:MULTISPECIES: DNA translocase FtsK [Paraliobacillus]|uniref:DNA translocase FtsK n=1 Tax=Paraliobacillus TaxID=200903 RepID=UPI001E35608A|nr:MULTISPECIES: DNA translocase FtsK [Paraliobacillus]
MKNKIKQLLDTEETIEPPKTRRNHTSNNHVETKVSYEYPTNRKFDFPIIPDKPKKEFSRRPSVSELETNVAKFKDKQLPEEKVFKRKFSATEVPSPIYGFGKRPGKTIETDTPAFLRKEKIHQQSNLTFSTTEDLLDETLSDDKLNKLHEDNPYIKPQVIEEKEVAFENFSQVEQVNEIEVDNVEAARFEEKQKTVEFNNRKVRERNAVPFNVRMRPSDKKRYHQKNNQIQQQQSKKNAAPPLYLLNDPIKRSAGNQQWIEEQATLLETTLKQFHVNAKVINTMQGPSVTRFEIQPEAGVKVSKIKNLSDDIKLNMAAKDIRMEAPIPGKHAIGIEIPNADPQAVGLQEIFEDQSFHNSSSALSVALGLDIAGSPVITDIKKMPHGLIAGATGSGKSVCINSILISLLYKASHEDVRFLLIDPKMVELAPYNGIPHLVSPVITDVKAATHALKWAVAEMEERYQKFAQEGARDIDRYNEKMKTQNKYDQKMPYLVIVIDELADLMMVSPQDVEDAICRIAQKARACGIHLLLATQRPSVDVITGLIKANIPTRIAFSVSSQVDSRTIIDTNGADRLLGKGDMLFVENGARNPVRIQGAFVSDDEIERVTSYVKQLAPPNYLFEQEQLLKQIDTEETEDDLYPEVLSFVLEQNGASASLVQRRFKVGYNRAARLIDTLEHNGIISAQKGSKPRDVLVSANEMDTERIQ